MRTWIRRQDRSAQVRTICRLLVRCAMLCVLWSPLSGQAPTGTSIFPVAINAITETRLVVYDSANRVSEIHIDSNSHSSKLLFTVDGNEIPVGMAIGLYKKQAYLFVLTKSANSKHGTIQVFTYPQGQPTGGKLALDDVATGLDYDEAAGTLYYVTLSNGRLFRFVQCTGKTESIGSIPGLGRAGPVAVLPGPRVDPCRDIQSSRSRLYVGDVLQGGLFRYDLGSKNIDKISKYIGSVSSALVHRGNRGNPMLYAADASRHVIIPFSIQTDGTLVERPAVGEGALTTPSSIAVMSSFNVVSDIDRHSIVVFSTNWQRLYQIDPKKGFASNDSPW